MKKGKGWGVFLPSLRPEEGWVELLGQLLTGVACVSDEHQLRNPQVALTRHSLKDVCIHSRGSECSFWGSGLISSM